MSVDTATASPGVLAETVRAIDRGWFRDEDEARAELRSLAQQANRLAKSDPRWPSRADQRRTVYAERDPTRRPSS